ncbi:hypothetical protein BGP78_10335 [Pseudoalteromonas sp. MSK9-3]|nr:hypothetical protein BGP78_10335 [Pseudoalteromonas sp. MSK9-3]
MMYRKKVAALYEFAFSHLPQHLFEQSTILGFGKIGIDNVSDEKFSIDTIIAPIIEGKRSLEHAYRLPVNISNLGFLASRMPIINGKLRGREVKNQFSIRVDLLRNYKPQLCSFAELPIDDKWYSCSFRDKFSDIFGAFYLTAEAIRLDTKQNIKVFIPCSEILRFYYPHTSLVEAAFTGRQARQALYNPDIELNKDDRPFVQLRKKIPDVCAPHVARIRHSDFAEKVFERIYTDSIHSVPLTDNAHRLLKVYPPLQGEVDWLVEANELECGSLLISGIYQCNGAFPFNELMFGRDNDGRTPEGRKQPDYLTPFPVHKPTFPSDTDLGNPNSPLPLSLGGMADVQIETLDIEFDFEQDTPNFEGLLGLSVKKIEKMAVKDPEVMNIQVYVGEKAVAGVVASGYLRNDNQDKFAKAEISMGTVKKSSVDLEKRSASFFDAFDVFQNAIHSLKDEYHISWRKASVWRIPTKSSFYLNAFLPKEIGDNDFLMLGKRDFEQSGPERKFELSRKFVIAELSFDDKHVYFVDFEKKKMNARDGTGSKRDSTSVLFFYDTDGDYLSNQQLKKVILGFAGDRSGWPDSKTRFRLQHNDDVEKFADKLHRKANKAFNVWGTLESLENKFESELSN